MDQVLFLPAGQFFVANSSLLNYETLQLDRGVHFVTYVVAENANYNMTSSPNKTTYQRNDVLLNIYVTDKPEPITIANLPTEVGISEDILTSSILFNVTYSDEDMFDNYTWSIVETWPQGAPFDIDGEGNL